jgi:hypothetical protein
MQAAARWSDQPVSPASISLAFFDTKIKTMMMHITESRKCNHVCKTYDYYKGVKRSTTRGAIKLMKGESVNWKT